MIRAYSEHCLNDAKARLSSFLDYAINDCGISPDLVSGMFVSTGIAEEFGRGNPAFISGMTGIELAQTVITKACSQEDYPQASGTGYASPEYWAGRALAEYQFRTGRRFRNIFERIPLSDIIGMYPVYHERNISDFIRAMEDRYRTSVRDSNLKRIRENRGLSQSELAEQSGVNIRNIQMYEQKVNDIDKAQGQLLYKLSRVLGCDIEDLLEDPMI